MQRSEQELARQSRFGGLPSGLLMLDIDHFKHVNDTFGHAAGDEVLRAFGDMLMSSLRKTDLAARVGGEEFVVMLTGTSTENTLLFAKKILQRTSELKVAFSRETIRFTVSIGITLLASADASIDVVLARADEALYAAKSGGRNRVCMRLPEDTQATSLDN